MSPFVTDQPKPVLKRSASLNVTTPLRGHDMTRERMSCLRYKPYPSRPRRSSRLLSNSPSHSCDENNQDSNSNSVTTSRRHSLPGKHRNVKAPSGDIEILLREQKSPKEGKLSVLEIASRLKKSLTIGQTILASTTCNGHFRKDAMEKDQIGDSHKENTAPGSHTLQKSCDEFRGKVLERDINQENSTLCEENTFEDIFLPSFDDEFDLPEMTCSDLGRQKGTNKKALKESEIDSENAFTLEDGFLDNESIIQELRKANTVLIFDDKNDENDNELGNDFTLPPLHRVVSCEGQKAKLEWECTTHHYDSTGKGHYQYVDLEEMLSNDWLNRNTNLTPLQNTNYRDLSEMQGTYTCSVCDGNLEVEPFNTMDVCNSRWEHGVYSVLFNGLAVPRSHDCDVTLYCPSCCSDRVVFHADRLHI